MLEEVLQLRIKELNKSKADYDDLLEKFQMANKLSLERDSIYKAKIVDLTDNIKVLKSKNHNMKVLLLSQKEAKDTFRADVDALKEAARLLDTRDQSTQHTLDILRKTNITLSRDLNIAQAEMESLKKHNDMLLTKLRDETVSIFEYEACQKKLQSLQVLVDRDMVANEVYFALQKEFDNYKAVSKDAADMHTSQYEKYQKMVHEEFVLKSDHHTLQKELDETKLLLHTRVDTMRYEHQQELNEAIAKYESIIKHMKEEHSTGMNNNQTQHSYEMESLKSQYTSDINAVRVAHKAEVDNMKVYHQDLTSTMQTSHQDLIDAMKRNHQNEIESISTKYQAEIELLKIHYDSEFDAWRDKQKNELETIISNHQSTTNSMIHKYERELQTNQLHYQKEIESLEYQSKTYQESIPRLYVLKEDYQHLEQQYNTEAAERKMLETSSSVLQENLEETRGELTSVKNQLQLTTDQYVEAEGKFQSLKERLERLEFELNETKQAFEHTSKENMHMKNELMRYDIQLKEQQEQLQGLEQQKAHAVSMVGQLKNKLRQEQDEKQVLFQAKHDLEKENDKQKYEYSKTLFESSQKSAQVHTQQETQYHQKIAEQTFQLTKYEEELKSFSDAVTTLQTQNVSLQEENQQHRIQLTEYKGQLTLAQNTEHLVQQEKQVAEQQIAELKQERQGFLQKIEELTNMIEEFRVIVVGELNPHLSHILTNHSHAVSHSTQSTTQQQQQQQYAYSQGYPYFAQGQQHHTLQPAVSTSSLQTVPMHSTNLSFASQAIALPPPPTTPLPPSYYTANATSTRNQFSTAPNTTTTTTGSSSNNNMIPESASSELKLSSLFYEEPMSTSNTTSSFVHHSQDMMMYPPSSDAITNVSPQQAYYSLRYPATPHATQSPHVASSHTTGNNLTNTNTNTRQPPVSPTNLRIFRQQQQQQQEQQQQAIIQQQASESSVPTTLLLPMTTNTMTSTIECPVPSVKLPRTNTPNKQRPVLSANPSSNDNSNTTNVSTSCLQAAIVVPPPSPVPPPQGVNSKNEYALSKLLSRAHSSPIATPRSHRATPEEDILYNHDIVKEYEGSILQHHY